LGDVIDDHSAVGIPIVHRSQGLIPFLASGIPDFELDRSGIIEGDCLCQEGGSDCRLAVIIELVLNRAVSISSFMYVRLAAGDNQAIIEDLL
jgi:hypothetical protein